MIKLLVINNKNKLYYSSEINLNIFDIYNTII